jgi:hypothetical protein
MQAVSWFFAVSLFIAGAALAQNPQVCEPLLKVCEPLLKASASDLQRQA